MLKKHNFAPYIINNNYMPFLFLFALIIIQSFFLLVIADEIITKFLYSFSLIIFCLLLNQIHQILLKVFLVLSLLLTLFIYPTYAVYGDLDYNYIASIFYTNYSESFSYMNEINLKTWLILLGITLYTIFLLKLTYKPIENKIVTPILLMILLFFPAKKLISYGYDESLVDRYFNVLPIKRAVYILNQFNNVFKEDAYITKQTKKESSWLIKSTTNDPKKDIVIVVGESVRRDFLNSYGFKINNTPFITNSSNVQFNNYISLAPQTIKSLVRTLAVSNEKGEYQLNNNIVNLAKKIGYETYWISNQGRVGYHESPVSIIARNSNHNTFLKKGDSSGNSQDIEMLPFISEIIKNKNDKPKLIIIHMIGSHPYICDKTNDQYDEFFLSKQLSCYSKSIKNTDSFLNKIHKDLVKSTKNFNMIYLSDHGQKIHQDLAISHGNGFKEGYEVPLIIWGSDIGISQEINARRTGKDFIHLFNELTNTKTSLINKKYQFISEQKNEDSTTNVLNSNEEYVDYERLPTNTIESFLKKK